MHAKEAAAARTGWGRLVGLALGLALVVGVVLLAFSWPAVTAEPRDLPIGIVGDDEQVDRASDAIGEGSDGAVALERFDDREKAVDAIETRQVYGAVVFGAAPTDPPEVLTARAASGQVAQLLAGLASELQSQIDAGIREQVEAGVAAAQESAAAQMQQALQAARSGQAPQLPPTGGDSTFSIPVVTVEVTDIVPLSDGDPNGAGLTASAFPLVLGGMLGGVVITLAVSGPGRRRAVAVLLYSASAGVVLAGILQGMYGALQGNYWLNAAAMALAITAISGTITGLRAVLGRVGTALAAAFMILVANPLSAATVPVEFIAAPWGAAGQWMPPGAAATLLRDLSYFPNADAVLPWTVLAVWAIVGLGLTLITRRTAVPARGSTSNATEVVSEGWHTQSSA